MSENHYQISLDAEGLELVRSVREQTVAKIVEVIAKAAEEEPSGRFVEVKIEGPDFKLFVEVANKTANDIIQVTFRDNVPASFSGIPLVHPPGARTPFWF